MQRTLSLNPIPIVIEGENHKCILTSDLFLLARQFTRLNIGNLGSVNIPHLYINV